MEEFTSVYGWMIRTNLQSVKKVFREIGVGVLQTKILNFTSLSLVFSVKRYDTHTHTHTHTHARIYMPPLTRNITRRASRVHFTVCEERFLAVLKWKKLFLFSAQVKLKTMNMFFLLSEKHGEYQSPTIGSILYTQKKNTHWHSASLMVLGSSFRCLMIMFKL